jgi:Septum formation
MRPSWRRPSGRASTARLSCAPSAAAAVLALAALLAGCSGDAAPQARTGLGPGLPTVGACRVLTVADIAPSSNDTPTVPCSRPHTSVTIAVGGFPAAEVTNRNLSSGALGDEALQRCTAALKKTVGGDRTSQHTSLVGLAYYLPNQSELSKGARWYRCDLVIGGQDGLSLQNLPAKVDGLLSGTIPESVQACRTTADFTSGHAVPCDRRHVLRAIGIYPLPGGDHFPGQAKLRAASAAGCRRVIARWLHGRIDGGDAYQWPDRTGWDVLHDHTATCWTVTTS